MTYEDELKIGLKHVQGHAKAAEPDIDELVQRVNNIASNADVCILSLSSYAEARCMIAWFENHDLSELKQWAYVAGKLRMIYKIRRGPGRGSLSIPSSVLLFPLISDNQALVDWFVSYEDGYHPADLKNPKAGAYHDYQAVVALRRNWTKLAERSELFLSDIPKKQNKFAIDFHFYLGLAQGNVQAMQRVLIELTSPAIARKRNHDGDMGYTENLIGTDAVVLAKIAWKSGYDLQIDTPYIPTEWMPVSPLLEYTDPYEFMKAY